MTKDWKAQWQKDWQKRLGDGRSITADDFTRAVELIGRNAGPSMLLDGFTTGQISTDSLRAVLIEIWVLAEYPQYLVPAPVWCNWFRLAAYPRPQASLTLYRGAVPRHARGMSWTTDLVRAQWFAERPTHARGHVYRATVEPAGILASVDLLQPGGREEGEVIVDPDFLPRPLRRMR
jgi:hypothetical protein